MKKVALMLAVFFNLLNLSAFEFKYKIFQVSAIEEETIYVRVASHYEGDACGTPTFLNMSPSLGDLMPLSGEEGFSGYRINASLGILENVCFYHSRGIPAPIIKTDVTSKFMKLSVVPGKAFNIEVLEQVDYLEFTYDVEAFEKAEVDLSLIHI